MTDDAERFTVMYDTCRRRVWAYAAARAGRQVADEVSETFTVAWRRFGDIPEPPLPWLLGVARNVLRDTVRAEIRRASFSAELHDWVDPGAVTEGDIADEVADRLALRRALGTLGEDDREVLILAAWQGLGPRDAARVVGCTAATMRVRLHRARRRLAAAVENTAAASRPHAGSRVRLAGEEA
ncbi:RNA polymerase sigma factor [Streptomyces meridianus]|uniref:Sigma-70 family RNA polymerase sigma factor n=1 Tax=Streptomyces meridianus TaxID=2938945 RepID=A0ABT0X7W7_9ACTN|nr:sigma-70 family RNA polymerase sigma factor [Streptomyces meridianus]MCM2578028.1 sigma-70 family RNA polymerase sigma factor [Streptomyces meridianus]